MLEEHHPYGPTLSGNSRGFHLWKEQILFFAMMTSVSETLQKRKDCLEVLGDHEIALTIDGYPETLGYVGTYFPGDVVTLSLQGEVARTCRAWNVNGERLPRGPLRLELRQSTRVRPLFD